MNHILLSGGKKMKKLAIILALLLVPMTAFGMDTISDTDLDAVTGQAGVSIALNSICIQNSAGTVGYGDVDSGKWLLIVGNTFRSRTIGFHGADSDNNNTLDFDTLTIDVINILDAAPATGAGAAVVNLRTLVVSTDLPTNSEAAVKIELCDVIQIEEDLGEVKYIYTAADYLGSGLDSGDMIIATYSAAGTTRIIGAGMGASSQSDGVHTGNLTRVYDPYKNTALLITAHGSDN
jgi:uncharacterized protein DUF6160